MAVGGPAVGGPVGGPVGSIVAGSVMKSRPVGEVQVRMPPGCWATLHRVWVFNAWLGLHKWARLSCAVSPSRAQS